MKGSPVTDIARFCCHPDCEASAEFEVRTLRAIDGGTGIAGPDPYCDETDGCELHVGYLLGMQPDCALPEQIYWEVIPLKAMALL